MNRPVLPARPLGTAALLAVAALPALAEPFSPEGAQMRSWGDGQMAFVRIVPGEDHPATVVFENQLTYGNPLEMVFMLSMDDLMVEVVMTLGSGDEPDVMTVILPPGFMAEPAQSIEVAEGDTGEILVQFMPMS